MTYVCVKNFGPLMPGDILIGCAKTSDYIYCWSPKFEIQFKITVDQLKSNFKVRHF